MTRLPLFLTALAATSLTLPAIAQTPTPPGAPLVSRAVAGSYTVDPLHSQIGFTVSHLGYSFYRGIFGHPEGTMTLDPKAPETAKVSIDIPIDGIVTTVPALDTHLKSKDFFDAAEFPKAHFESTSVKVTGTKAVIGGNLTIRGVTRPVVLKATFVGAGTAVSMVTKQNTTTVGFEATTTIKRSDYGVSYGLGLLSDEIPLTIAVAFEKPAA